MRAYSTGLVKLILKQNRVGNIYANIMMNSTYTTIYYILVKSEGTDQVFSKKKEGVQVQHYIINTVLVISTLERSRNIYYLNAMQLINFAGWLHH